MVCLQEEMKTDHLLCDLCSMSVKYLAILTLAPWIGNCKSFFPSGAEHNATSHSKDTREYEHNHVFMQSTDSLSHIVHADLHMSPVSSEKIFIELGRACGQQTAFAY